MSRIEIISLLRDIGVPANLRGYDYLKKALELLLEDPSYIHGITKRLYPDIAKSFGTTSSAVERCIRHAIYRTTAETPLQHAPGGVKNGSIMAFLAEKLRQTID